MSEDHLARYMMYCIEKCLVKEKVYTEFLWQLFDMYGPSWTPMPRNWHLDFYAAFEKSSQKIEQSIKNDLLKEYSKLRKRIFYKLSSICEKRRRLWLSGINTEINSRIHSNINKLI